MKTLFTTQKSRQAGSALMLTMIMLGVALIILAAALSWSATSTRLTYRSIQYTRSEAAAEAATEKVVSQISHDFLYYGENTVINNLNSYRNVVPSPSDSAYWSTWQFNDANGNAGQTYVHRGNSVIYTNTDPPYNNLQGYISTYTVVSDAKDTASPQDLTVGVLQQLHLITIPVFQYALFSSGNMEISCGEPFDITGPVHSNGHLYVEPDSSMKFESEVGAVLDVLFQRDPLDTRGRPAGGVTYVEQALGQPQSGVPFLTLPIGTNNTPEGVREIIEPPPLGEDATSPIGILRYYNRCDMLVTVSNTGVTARSGIITGFNTPIPTNELSLFVSTNNSFWDAREGKTVQPIDLDIGNLAAWSQTNTSLSPFLGGSNLTSIYVDDRRTLPGTSLGAVRVVNGATLPPKGLTVATGRPLYVQSDYNSDFANRLPASLVADAITILSDSWHDNYGNSLHRATATTVNAALLTGVVETTLGQYSGGMENFPRFLETWTDIRFTYNGSMVKMFPSLYATNVWGGSYYDPPVRIWAFDTNFRDRSKLPWLTPSHLVVQRTQWTTLPPGQTVAP
jgi:Tfp pilus assembly protein PilX